MRAFLSKSSFLRDESGATSMEYGLIVALIAAICIVSFGLTGAAVEASYNDTVAKMPKT